MSDAFTPVPVELDAATRQPVRVFRTTRQAVTSAAYHAGLVYTLPYCVAVEIIRRAVFKRDLFACVHCAELVSWESGELHERHARGDVKQISPFEYQGGEISVANSETRCHNCHTGPGGAHDRNPRWSV